MNIPTRKVETPDGERDFACTQDVCDALGITVTPTMIINTLGVPADFRRKSAYYWQPANVVLIKGKLIEHLVSL